MQLKSRHPEGIPIDWHGIGYHESPITFEDAKPMPPGMFHLGPDGSLT